MPDDTENNIIVVDKYRFDPLDRTMKQKGDIDMLYQPNSVIVIPKELQVPGAEDSSIVIEPYKNDLVLYMHGGNINEDQKVMIRVSDLKGVYFEEHAGMLDGKQIYDYYADDLNHVTLKIDSQTLDPVDSTKGLSKRFYLATTNEEETLKLNLRLPTDEEFREINHELDLNRALNMIIDHYYKGEGSDPAIVSKNEQNQLSDTEIKEITSQFNQLSTEELKVLSNQLPLIEAETFTMEATVGDVLSKGGQHAKDMQNSLEMDLKGQLRSFLAPTMKP